MLRQSTDPESLRRVVSRINDHEIVFFRMDCCPVRALPYDERVYSQRARLF